MSTALATVNWGTSPKIGVSFAYDKRRSGADMQYKVYVSVSPVTGASYFGYPIYLSITLAGTLRVNKYTLKSSSPSQWSSAITYSTDWITVPNKTSGTTALSINLKSGSGSTRNTTYSYNLPISAALSVVAANNGTLGTTQSLTITKYDTTFKHTITYTCGNASGTICTASTATTVSFTPPFSLAAQNTTGTSVQIALTITTLNSSNTAIGSTKKTITAAIPTSVKPSVSLSLSDPTGCAEIYGGYVQKCSKLLVALNITTAHGAAIKARQINVGNFAYSAENEFETPVLPSSGTIPITVTVTDTRGRTGTASRTITVLPYTAPTVLSLSAYRCEQNGAPSGTGTYMAVKFTAAVTSLSNKNTSVYAVEYREHGTDDWQDVPLSSLNNDYTPTDEVCIIAADPQKSFDVRVAISDALSETINSNISVIPVGYALAQWDSVIKSFAIGQFAVDPNTFAVALTAVLKNGLNVIGDIKQDGTNVLGVELFSGAFNYSPNTVTLSDSITNYNYIDIYFHDNDSYYGFTRVKRDGATINAVVGHYTFPGSNAYYKALTVTLSGTSATSSNGHQYAFATNQKSASTSTGVPYITIDCIRGRI